MSFSLIKVVRGSSDVAPLLELIQQTTQEAFVCGGYVRWMCSNNYNPVLPGDIDIYCKDKEAYNILLKKFSSMNMIYSENRIASMFSVDRKDHAHPLFALPDIQLIKPMKIAKVVTQGTMEEILNSFDFTVIRLGLLSDKVALADDDFYEHEGHKLLVIKNIHCPISSTFRFMKYFKKGYWAKLTEIVKLFIDWDGRDAKYRIEIMDFISRKDNLSENDIMRLEELMRID
jgi:hypothetical protein